MSQLHKLTAQQTIQKIKSNEVCAQECVEAVFEQIHKVEDKINAYVTLVEEQALSKAKEIDKKISEGKTSWKTSRRINRY